jgi:hypothetical protein
MLTRRRVAMALTTAALGAGAVGTALASTETTAQAPVRSVAPAAVSSVSVGIERQFAVFRSQPATPMPADVAEAVASPARFGRNAALARDIWTVNGRGWVVPGDQYICIVVPDPVDGYGTGCTRLAWAQKSGVILEMRDLSGHGSSTALAPDPASVQFMDAAGAARTIPTNSGVVSRVVGPGEELQLAAP